MVPRPMSNGTTVATPPPTRSGLASVKEAEQFLSLSRSSIYQLMDKGDLRYVKLGKSRRIPWDAIEELVRQCTVKAS